MAASETIPPHLREAVGAAARGNEPSAFHAALREAIAAAPSLRQEILLFAVDLRPDWAAELLVAALYDPPLSPSSDAASDAVLAAAGYTANGYGAATVANARSVQQAEGKAPRTESPWSGEVELGGIARSGNTENVGVSGGAELTYRLKPWSHILEGSFDYLRGRRATEAQAFEAEYQLQYDLTESTFVYGLSHYEDDRFSGFDYEFTASTGLGSRLIDDETLTWTLAAGPSIRVFSESDEGTTKEVPGVRVNNDVTWQISESAKLANETEVRLDSDRSEIENEASLTLQIIESLAGRLSFSAQYRSPVPSDTEKLETTSKASVIYGF